MALFVVSASDTRSRRLASTACFVLLVIVVVVWSGPEVLASRFAAGDWGDFNNRRGAHGLTPGALCETFRCRGRGSTPTGPPPSSISGMSSIISSRKHTTIISRLPPKGGLLLILPVTRLYRNALFGTCRVPCAIDAGSMAWWIRAGAVTSLLAIACQETVEFSLQMPGNAVLFTIVCAIALHNPANIDDPVEATVIGGTGQASSRPIRLEFARRIDRR